MVPSERSCGRGVWVSTMLGAHQKSARAARPARHTPPPAALLCLRPARQDADYGRARWTSALPEPRQPSGCCVQALRDPWGQACWLREQPHPIAGDSAHRPLAAMTRSTHQPLRCYLQLECLDVIRCW